MKTIWYVFTPPISLLKLYVSVRCNHEPVVNTLGSVVDKYSVPSLNSLCRVSELEELTLAFWHCPLGHLFSFKSYLILSILTLCFCKQHHHLKGNETCFGMFTHKLHWRRQEPTTESDDDWVGHLNPNLALGGGNLNNPIFKSSNVRGGGGAWRCWSFEFARRILIFD